IGGGLLAGLPLMVYNKALFGSIFTISYSFGDWDENRQNLWGIAWPNPAVAVKLLVSQERGLLWLSPILALAPAAWLSMKKSGEISLMLLCVAVFIYYITINSGIPSWEAGYSTGPRYMVPGLAFLALPFAWLSQQCSSAVFKRGMFALL